MDECEHKYQYMGLQYAVGAYSMAGSGAHRRYYGHVFFCEKCTHMKAETNLSIDQNTYEHPLDNSTPGRVDLLVPKHDQPYGRY